MINNVLRKAIIAHAKREFPRECCGLLVSEQCAIYYYPCRNQAEGTDHFILHPDDYAEAEKAGEILAVVHSHPSGPAKASQADIVACEASGLPWYIVTWPGEEWEYIEPSGYEAPLVGRIFSHGVLDCYSIIRDWYRMERGIQIPDFERRDNWWYNGGNLYVDNFETAGFYRVFDPPEKGDVLLMQVLANVPNHAAIYLGHNIILHHLHGRLSCREVYGGYWQKHTVAVLKYGGVA